MLIINRTRLIALSLSGGLAACASAPPPPPPPPPKPVVQKVAVPENRLEAGNEAFVSGKYDAALADYDAYLAKNPKDATAAYNRAVTLQELGRGAEAELAYEEIVGDNPKHVDATLNLGAIYNEAGETSKAITVYERYLKDDPHNSRVLNNLVALYRAEKKYAKAIKTVRKLLMRDQKNIDAYKNLALVYYDQKKFKLTQTILANASAMAKEAGVKDADIPVNLGLTHLALGDNGRAMAAFKEAAAIDAKHTLANYNIGALALAHRDYKLAAGSFDVAAQEWPKDFEVIASLGFAYQGLADYDKSEKYLRDALAIKKDENVVEQLMVVLQTAEKTDDALKVADQLLEMKGMTCGAEDYDGLCGRINGLKMMKEMAEAPEPAAEEEAPKATGQDIFTEEDPGEDVTSGDAPAEGAEGGEAAPAEGGEAAAPAEGGEG